MLGFTPLAAAPLADSGKAVYEIACDSISTTPVVDAALIVQGTDFPANDILAGAPLVDAIDPIFNHNFGADSLTSTPTVDLIDFAQVHELSANDLSTTPSVDSPTVSFADVLSAVSLGPEVTEYTVTVADNGGNKFYIDGVSNPTLSLVRGQKYVFDLSDSSNSGHPLVFTLSDGTTSYTDGVTTTGTAGTSGATVTFLVPSDAPASLRYVCSVHGSGMGNTISVSTQAIGLQPTVDEISLSITSNFTGVDLIIGAPLLDTASVFEDETVTPLDIVAGAVSVESINPQVTSNFTANDITSGLIVDNISASITSNFAASDLSAGSPVVDSIEYFKIYNFTASDIAASVSIDSIVATFISSFTAVSIETQPVVAIVDFKQNHVFGASEVTAGIPTLPARFLWDFQELAQETWDGIGDNDLSWSAQSETGETWANISDINTVWSDQDDTQETWSSAA